MGLTPVESKSSTVKMPKCRDKRRDTPGYWEERLKRMGLTEDAGRRIWISYGHMISDLDFDGRKTYKPIDGERLDPDEWPVSLY